MAQVDMMGTVFTWNGSTVSYVHEIEGPGIINEQLEVTNFASTGGYREFIAGPRDGGEVKLSIWYDPTDATHNGTTGLVADANGGTSRAFAVNWSGTGVSWSGNGVITEFMPKGSFEDALGADVTIKVSGALTVA